MVGDPQTGQLWAGGGGDWSGAAIWNSDDHGETWNRIRLTKGSMDDWAANDADFAAMIDWSDEPLPFADQFSQIWSLCHAHGKLYAGVKPAGLLVSEDGGNNWKRNDGLDNHPSAGSWTPGAAGLVLHTIVPHPEIPTNSGSGSLRPVSSPQRTAASPGSGATVSPMPGNAPTMIIRQHPVTERSAIAFTT